MTVLPSDSPEWSNVRVEYETPDLPILAVRLQEMFGCKDTPRLVDGKIPVMLHLLSPAKRPVQITKDLSRFWKSAYVEVKKELRGRYPKHSWPDDPLQPRQRQQQNGGKQRGRKSFLIARHDATRPSPFRGVRRAERKDAGG
jgi:HrpA-like RNA helicase